MSWVISCIVFFSSIYTFFPPCCHSSFQFFNHLGFLVIHLSNRPAMRAGTFSQTSLRLPQHLIFYMYLPLRKCVLSSLNFISSTFKNSNIFEISEISITHQITMEFGWQVQVHLLHLAALNINPYCCHQHPPRRRRVRARMPYLGELFRSGTKEKMRGSGQGLRECFPSGRDPAGLRRSEWTDRTDLWHFPGMWEWRMRISRRSGGPWR